MTLYHFPAKPDNANDQYAPARHSPKLARLQTTSR